MLSTYKLMALGCNIIVINEGGTGCPGIESGSGISRGGDMASLTYHYYH